MATDRQVRLMSMDISSMRSRLAKLEDALRRIAEHEHLKCLESECEGMDPTKVSEWLYEIQKTNLILGKIYGHRCCAAIAADALKEEK